MTKDEQYFYLKASIKYKTSQSEIRSSYKESAYADFKRTFLRTSTPLGWGGVETNKLPGKQQL
jgi:hypothetical protein